MKHALLLAAVGTMLAPQALRAAEPGNWSGAYVGGSVGYAWQRGTAGETLLFDTNADGAYGDTVRTAAGANAFSPGFCGGAALTAVPGGGCTGDSNGVAWSVHGGYDWQRNNLVFGVVLEGGHANIRDGVSGYSTTPANYVMTRAIDANGALRGRVGAIWNDTLFYVTGGLAYAEVDNRFTSTNTANAFSPPGEGSAWGWTAGLGLEQQMNERWTVGVLALYTRYTADDAIVNVSRGTAPATNPFVIAPAGSVNLARSEDNWDNTSVAVTVSYRLAQR